MNFKLTDLEKKRILHFIEQHLLFVEDTYLINSFRNIIKHDLIPDFSNISAKYKCGEDGKYLPESSPGTYIITWTPVGFKSTYVISFSDLSVDGTDYNMLENCYKSHKDMYYDKTNNKSYTYEELLNISPFSLMYINGGGIGIAKRIICNSTNESENITDYDVW